MNVRTGHLPPCRADHKGVDAERLQNDRVETGLLNELPFQPLQRVFPPVKSASGQGPSSDLGFDRPETGEQDRTISHRQAIDPDPELTATLIDQHGSSMTPVYEPMLATTWLKIFSDPDWFFELKWDGYRALAYFDNGRVSFRSRRGLDLGYRYPELAALRSPRNAVVDGEIVAMGEDGKPSFFMLGRIPAQFVAFDVLFLDGDLTGLPFEDRRRLLESMELTGPVVVTDVVPEAGEALFMAVEEQGLEGVVAKRAGSRYHPGKRSPDWRKVVFRRNTTATVGGFLHGEGNRTGYFGSLLLGMWTDDQLHFVGAVGSGFDDPALRAITRRLSELARESSPFAGPVDVPGTKSWVEPVLVARVEYREWTPYGRLRAPVFKGLEVEPS